jgi:hypothetical protein
MARVFLLFFFATIFVAMVAVTVYASLDRSILKVGPELTSDPWFQATLADAYFGFLTFYAWAAYRERGLFSRVLWFVLIMTLGNIAISAYMIIRLWVWQPTEGSEALLLRREP